MLARLKLPVVVGALSFATSPSLVEATETRVSYLGCSPSADIDQDTTAAFNKAVQGALSATSVVNVRIPRSEIPRAIDGTPCVTVSCLDRIRGLSNVTHVIRGTITSDPIQGILAYHVVLDLIDATNGQLAVTVTTICDRCTEAVLRREVDLYTSALMGQYFNDPTLSKDPTSSQPSGPKLTAPADVGTPERGPVEAVSLRPIWPLALTAGGVGLMGAGAVLFAIGDHSLCGDNIPAARCSVTRDFRPAAYGLGVAGVAMAATGTWLYFRRNERSRADFTAIATPSSIELAGSF